MIVPDVMVTTNPFVIDVVVRLNVAPDVPTSTSIIGVPPLVVILANVAVPCPVAVPLNGVPLKVKTPPDEVPKPELLQVIATRGLLPDRAVSGFVG